MSADAAGDPAPLALVPTQRHGWARGAIPPSQPHKAIQPMKATLTSRALAAALCALLASPVWSQSGNAFGSTKRNPGSIVAEW